MVSTASGHSCQLLFIPTSQVTSVFPEELIPGQLRLASQGKQGLMNGSQGVQSPGAAGPVCVFTAVGRLFMLAWYVPPLRVTAGKHTFKHKRWWNQARGGTGRLLGGKPEVVECQKRNDEQILYYRISILTHACVCHCCPVNQILTFVHIFTVLFF